MTNVYTDLFEQHHSDEIERLWPWQKEILAGYAESPGDAAVELPTGSGKTLIALLVGEQHRAEGKRVAYLTGNKQLSQQVERQALDLDFPVVRFEGSKGSWDRKVVRKYNFRQAIGVMNYWNYFNAKPGIEPADILILDDVHLLEGPLRDMFTVSIGRSDSLFEPILTRIVERYPYYSWAEDLLNRVDVIKPPEMLAFPDSAEMAEEIRDLLDAGLEERSSNWWAWQLIRERLGLCCWLVSRTGVNFAPFVPPTQTLEHFQEPSRRLYLSATIGSVDDLQRRLGAPPLTLLEASAQPRQGERMVVVRDDPEAIEEAELVSTLEPILEEEGKALWLCARKDTAANLAMALEFAGLDGAIRVLEGDNAADEPFAEEEHGHLVTAGRYDGMDFPGDTCRLEVIPEVPVATSPLEEFVAAFLRDAPFAQARFGQRVAQALGRCNRKEDDRAVYLLTDPEFLGRFSQQSVLDALVGHVREDVFAALVRSDAGFEANLAEATAFLDEGAVEPITPMERGPAPVLPATAADEVEGILALWAENYTDAAHIFDKVALELADYGEYRGFWLAMRALALGQSARLGDKTAARGARRALKAAVAAGNRNVFFSRLHHAELRTGNADRPREDDGDAELFAAWDRLMDRHGTGGPQFDRWADRLLSNLTSSDHDTVANAIADVGADLLGAVAGAPQATHGEEDAYWELVSPRRTLAFEVKMAPKVKVIVNDDVEQAEGAVRAAEVHRGHSARGILITPHPSIEETAAARLERVSLMTVATFVEQVEKLLTVLRIYRREWAADSAARSKAREAALVELPPVGWIWEALSDSDDWIEPVALNIAWDGRS
jgi:hypothetical protein